jgi:hypothetical protein
VDTATWAGEIRTCSGLVQQPFSELTRARHGDRRDHADFRLLAVRQPLALDESTTHHGRGKASETPAFSRSRGVVYWTN